MRAKTHREAWLQELGNRVGRLLVILQIVTSTPQHAFGDVGLGGTANRYPHDIRLEPLRHFEGDFPFVPSASADTWGNRSEHIRRDLAVALGLWPMPDKTPLNACVFGRINAGDYTVDKVYFESLPGFYVTGSLYWPRGRTGRVPAVLCPHGHWPGGRFMDCGEEQVVNQIEQGGERFREGGRSQLQSRCVQLARMGCVAFAYDMIGYADSVQISAEVAHSSTLRRPEMDTEENWGFHSPQAEAHLQSIMGLQTWNSIRALDFLVSLREVDPDRLGVTGESGGGTQTLMLCALDPRPVVAFPAVMVTSSMQGGCACENASLLRLTEGNVAFAALFAPKPMGLTAANDWTVRLLAQGFPELAQHYSRLGDGNNVMLAPLLQFQHNFNYVSRRAMYGWMNQHLRLGLKEPIVEQDYHRLTLQEQSVWGSAHPAPRGGPDYERRLLTEITTRDQKQLKRSQESVAGFRQVYGGAIDSIIGRNIASAGQVNFHVQKRHAGEPYRHNVGWLKNNTYGEARPMVWLEPHHSNHRVVIWISGAGTAGLFSPSDVASQKPIPAIRELLAKGVTVMGVDLFGQGEVGNRQLRLDGNRRVAKRGALPAFTYGYNRALFAQRVHDVLSVIQLAREVCPGARRIDLVGLQGGGPWAAAAGAQAREVIAGLALDTEGFRFGRQLDAFAAGFLPGGAKYGDLPALLALAAPAELWLAGEGQAVPQLTESIYQMTGSAADLQLAQEGVAYERQIVAWLLQRPLRQTARAAIKSGFEAFGSNAKVPSTSTPAAEK